MPQLGILACLSEQPHNVWWRRNCEGRGWVAGGCIGAAAGVINKAQDVQGALNTSVRRRIEGPLGSLATNIKEGAANEKPHGWGCGAALSCSKQGTKPAMLNVPLGDAHLGLDVELGLLESSTVHNAHLFVKAFGTTYNICNEGMDPIIIGFAVIVIHYDSQACEACDLVLQLLDKHWIETFFSGHGSMAVFIDELLVTCEMQQVAPFDSHEQVPVPPAQMDCSQAVQLRGPRIFLKHVHDDAQPACTDTATIRKPSETSLHLHS